MQIDATDIAKFVAAGSGFGGTFAVMRPFAERLFSFWLRRLEERAIIEDSKARAIERIAVQHERITGILEVYAQRLDRVDARLNRIEAHAGITPSDSAVPPSPAPVAPRKMLADQVQTLAQRASSPSLPDVKPE